jgi:hypothetical protein
MKKLILLFLLWGTCVWAQDEAPTPNTSPGALTWDALLGYSSADKFDVSGANDIESETAFNFGARLTNQFAKSFAYNAGLSVETLRDFKGTTGSIGFFLLEGNFILNFDTFNLMYAFVGANYPLLIMKSHVSTSPEFGMQFGTGLKFTPVLGLEFYYRIVNMHINSHSSGLMGFGLRGYYTFSSF